MLLIYIVKTHLIGMAFSHQEARKSPITARGLRRNSRDLEDINRRWAEYDELSRKLNSYYQIGIAV